MRPKSEIYTPRASLKKNDRPLKSSRKRSQSIISNLVPCERRMWWWRLLTPLVRSIMRRGKARPGTNTRQFNKPISDWSSFRQVERRAWKFCNIARHFWCLSSGRRASWRTVACSKRSVSGERCEVKKAPLILLCTAPHYLNAWNRLMPISPLWSQIPNHLAIYFINWRV